MNNKFIIYALIDPRSGLVRYVGKSCSGMNRPLQHLSKTAIIPRKDRKSGNLTKRQAWLKSLFVLGLKPVIEVLETCSEAPLLIEREKYWIKFYSEKGELTNLTEGGEGVSGRTPWNKGLAGDSRNRGGRKPGSVAWNKGTKQTDIVKAIISEKLKGNIPGNSRPVMCINDEKQFKSTGEAARFYGLKTTGVYDVCCGKIKSTGGLSFKYIG